MTTTTSAPSINTALVAAGNFTARPPWAIPLLFLLALCGGALLFSGCTSIINNPQGKIVSVTERFVGFQVKATSTTSQSPEVIFGAGSSTTVLLPTSTNGPVSSPNFANTVDFRQSGALSLGIGESIASGNYQTSETGATNSAITTQPITPK